MWEHTQNVHRGQIGDNGGVSDNRFKVSSNFKRCLQRQIDEGLRMKRKEEEGSGVEGGGDRNGGAG